MPSEGSREASRKRQRYNFAAFRGYRGPRFTPVPDEFLDHQLADLSSAEVKVLVFLFRKTYGYRKSGDRVSFAQLQYGTVSSDGTIIDRGTGLSRATIWRALKGLQDKGLIEVYRQTTPAGDADVNYYRIREDLGPEHDSPSTTLGTPARQARGTKSSASGRARADSNVTSGGREQRGWDNNETTPTSELNHPGFTLERPGSSRAEPTREDYTKQDYTLSTHLKELALDFLTAIGYSRPAPAKREKTVSILLQLHQQEGYTLEELRAACRVAASVGARGPELIPHVIGKTVSPESSQEVGERLAAQEQKERLRWERLSRRFEELPEAERERLLRSAQRLNDILRQRPLDHPLVRAAAIGMLESDDDT